MRLGSILFPDSVVCVFKKAKLHETYTHVPYTFSVLATDIVAAAVDNGDDFDDDDDDGDDDNVDDASLTYNLVSRHTIQYLVSLLALLFVFLVSDIKIQLNYCQLSQHCLVGFYLPG